MSDMSGGKIDILIVDDETAFRNTLAKRLAKRGFSVKEAGNAEECLSVIEKRLPELIVMDVKMPGLSGIEALEIIKRDYPGIEIILLTGHASTKDGVEGIKAGAFDYLSKPIELDHLIGKINQAGEKIKRIEEKKREAEFRAKMEQQIIATERLASLGTLASGVAHEINNPLAIIGESAGWMKSILEKEELASIPRRSDLENALGKIENAIERAKIITHQLLGIARKNDSSLSVIDIARLIFETTQLLERDAENRDIEIIRDVRLSSPEIWSDPYQLRQVFINLMTNAMHSIGSSGTITLRLEDNRKEVFVKVIDNGTGIAGENLERIFEPFFSTKAPGEGTGLGLYVTRGILEKLGGRIDVESSYGKGASFTVTLPRRYPFGMESKVKNNPGMFEKLFNRG